MAAISAVCKVSFKKVGSRIYTETGANYRREAWHEIGTRASKIGGEASVVRHYLLLELVETCKSCGKPRTTANEART